MFKPSITKDEINELPLLKFEGKIHLVTNRESFNHAIKILNQETLIGFDTETKPSFKKGEVYKVSLLQLSTASEAFLFRLNKFPFQGELVDLLANENIIKTGIAIHDDIKGLQKLSHFEPGGFVELATLAKEQGIIHPGLRSLAAIILERRISKNSKISNWEAPRLTQGQLGYAALDAWLGQELYLHLTSAS